MPRAAAIIALAALAVIVIAFFAWRHRDRPESGPAVAVEAADPGKATKPDKPQYAPPSPTPGAIPGDTRLKPGEVTPGSRPDTIIVQPVQPGPPKEISRSYRAPTPDEDPRIDRLEDGRLLFHAPISMARELHTSKDPQDDLGILEGILGYYRLVYKENPVAEDNAAVIRALTGRNEHQVVVFPEDHPDLDADGQLLDRWGTPYFFHALSRAQIDIWSAGPDLKFGSVDDLKLGENDDSLQLSADSASDD